MTMTAFTGFSNLRPPPFPQDSPYTACYCEENAYLLVEALNASPPLSTQSNTHQDAQSQRNQVWNSFVVVVTNGSKTVLLWDQKASQKHDQGSPVIWDYHLFVVVTCTLSDSNTLSSNDLSSTSNPNSPNPNEPQSPSISTETPKSSRKRRPSLFRKHTSKSRPASPSSPAVDSTQSFATSKDSKTSSIPLKGETINLESSKQVPYAWVYDFDSLLSTSKSQLQPRSNGAQSNSKSNNKAYPVPFKSYMPSTFRHLFEGPDSQVHPDLYPRFRLIPSRDFLYNFSSDRSHMLMDGIKPEDPLAKHPSSYLSPPPTWHMICGKAAHERGEAIGGNLKRWLDVSHLEGADEDQVGFGKVFSWQDFCSAKALEQMKRSSKAYGTFNHSSTTSAISSDQLRIGRRPPPPPPPSGDPSTLSSLADSSNSNGERPAGGRITSPDFPAYLASALRNRARDSYVD